MRIIAGARKGLRLEAPAGRLVRPTSDRAREGLMSALGGFFDGEAVLELCAGTGAVSLELLSRGCGNAVLVEHNAQALACIRRNIDRAAMADRTTLVQADVLDAIDRLRAGSQRFDLLFFDPPYDAEMVGPVLTSLADGALLNPGAEVIVEVRSSGADAALPSPWRLRASHRYGNSTLLRLRHPESERP